jgi:hypothetical protein
LSTNTRTADQVAQALPSELRQKLAVLHGWDEQLCGLILGRLPVKDRTALIVRGVIHRTQIGLTVTTRLSDFGREVLSECSRTTTPDEHKRTEKQFPELDSAFRDAVRAQDG